MPKTIFFIFITLISISAFAKKTYTIGVQNFETYHPYSEFKNNRYCGFNREVLDLFAKTEGFKFEYKARPIKRLHAEFVVGNFDFKYPDSNKWALDIKVNHKIYYSQTVVNYKDGLIVKKKNIGKPLTRLKNISLINGFTPAQQYAKARQSGSLNFIYTVGYKRLLELVSENRVDGAYFNIAVSKHHISHSQGEKSDLIFDDTLPYIKSGRSLSSIKHPDLILKFDKFLIDYKPQIDGLKIHYNIIETPNIPHRHAYKH